MKKSLFSLCLSLCANAVLAIFATQVQAAPMDLTSWTALGDTLVTASNARVTTAFTDEAPLSGSALDIFELEAQLAASSGALGAEAFEGSALVQSFIFSSNARVSFSWTLGTENIEHFIADLAFVLIDGRLLQPLANAAIAELSSRFSYNFTEGAHTLAFGVVDLNDFIGVSTLSVTNLDVSLIPEPGTLVLLLAGLGLALHQTKRRRSL